MNKKKESKTPSSRSVTLAFKSFAAEASEQELNEALRGSGIDPDSLESRADSAFDAAIKASRPKQQSAVQSGRRDNTDIILHKGLGALVRLLRRKNGLSEQGLADAADVDLTEIRKIECDENYSPSPRTIYQLEEYFEMPERTLALISGAMTNQSTGLKEEVLKFAARSDALGKLSREEQKLVNEFVRFLANELKKRN